MNCVEHVHNLTNSLTFQALEKVGNVLKPIRDGLISKIAIVALGAIAILAAIVLDLVYVPVVFVANRPNIQIVAKKNQHEALSPPPPDKDPCITPFYVGRRGFPNPSSSNCSYNSLSIAIAHSTVGNNILSPLPDLSQEDLKQAEEEAKSLKSEFLKLKKKKKGKEDLIKQLDIEKGEIQASRGIITRKLIISTTVEWTEIQRDLNSQMVRCQKNLKSAKAEIDDSISNHQKKVRANKQKLNELRLALERYREREMAKQRALEVIGILRTGKGRALTEEDAKNLHGCYCYSVNYPNFENRGYMPYNGQSAAEADEKKEELRKALFGSNWRVLRVGGGLHWWAYVRNRNSNTIDLINDSTVRRDAKTLQEIFNEFRRPEVWKKTQITFY